MDSLPRGVYQAHDEIRTYIMSVRCACACLLLAVLVHVHGCGHGCHPIMVLLVVVFTSQAGLAHCHGR